MNDLNVVNLPIEYMEAGKKPQITKPYVLVFLPPNTLLGKVPNTLTKKRHVFTLFSWKNRILIDNIVRIKKINMKQNIFALAILLLVASGALAQTESKEAVKKETQALIAVDLTPIGIPASIQAPPSVKAVEGSWSNSIVGDNNFEISVEETSTSYADVLDKIKADPDNTVIRTDNNAIMYKSTMMGREMVHFEYIIEIGGQLYRFYDKRVTPLDENGILPMYNAMLTIKEN